jgi:hypothetical protein
MRTKKNYVLFLIWIINDKLIKNRLTGNNWGLTSNFLFLFHGRTAKNLLA